MARRCVVQGCGAASGEVPTSFHRFPSGTMARDRMRRAKWISILRLEPGEAEKRFVCGQHFETGKPAAANDMLHQDWVPNINLPYVADTDDDDGHHGDQAETFSPINSGDNSDVDVTESLNMSEEWLEDSENEQETSVYSSMYDYWRPEELTNEAVEHEDSLQFSTAENRSDMRNETSTHQSNVENSTQSAAIEEKIRRYEALDGT